MVNDEILKIEIQNRFDELMKARRASVGEIRVWSDGKKYVKTPKGWVPVEKGNKVKSFKKDNDDYFGRNYLKYSGKPKEAIEFLLKNESGQVKNAWERKDVGKIDIVYGNDNKGLKHIVKRHIEEQNDFISQEDMAEKISDVLKNGSLSQTKKGRLLLEKDGYIAILNKEIVYDEDDNLKNKYWILTSYDNSKTIKDKLKKSFDYTLPGNSKTDKDQSLTVFSSESSLLLPKDTTNIDNMQQFVDEIIEKSKKGAPIGTEKTWGGKIYVKTDSDICILYVMIIVLFYKKLCNKYFDSQK